ncbi:MAG: DUF4197 domain-containing protein [Pseudomonadota bacterium]
MASRTPANAALKPCTRLALLALLFSISASADWREDLKKAAQAFGQSQTTQAALTDPEILKGLKEALAQGTTNAIKTLGKSDGYWANAQVRVPLPDSVGRIEKTLRMFGAGPKLDQFHLTLNRAAEKAVPQVADIFGNAVRVMTIQDVRGILSGQPDAATQFFKRTTSDAIRAKFLPIVKSATAQVGVTQQYKGLTQKYGSMMQLAGVPVVELDGYVTQKAMDGLFSTIAQEEGRIRADPAARGTEILKKVFGAKR